MEVKSIILLVIIVVLLIALFFSAISCGCIADIILMVLNLEGMVVALILVANISDHEIVESSLKLNFTLLIWKNRTFSDIAWKGSYSDPKCWQVDHFRQQFEKQGTLEWLYVWLLFFFLTHSYFLQLWPWPAQFAHAFFFSRV